MGGNSKLIRFQGYRSIATGNNIGIVERSIKRADEKINILFNELSVNFTYSYSLCLEKYKDYYRYDEYLNGGIF